MTNNLNNTNIDNSDSSSSTKMLFVKGDKVRFTITPMASFTKGNFFTGTIITIHKKIFSVTVRPSTAAAGRLGPILDSDGTLQLQFRCCRISSIKEATELRARIKKEAAARARHDKQRRVLAAAKKKAWETRANFDKLSSHIRPPKQSKKGKKAKKGWAYAGRIVS